MKITFLMPGHGESGGARVVAIYAERLVARGHAVHLVWSRGRSPKTWRRLVGRIRGDSKQHRENAFFRTLPVTQSRAATRGVITDADIPDGDVVVATWWETAFSAAELSPSKGAKVYFIQHHEVHEHLPVHLSRATYYLPLRKITISQWLVDLMRDRYGDPDVPLVENSVDMRQFDAPEREKNAVPTVGLLYSGKPFKGVDLSLEAIARARRQVPELKLLAFGMGDPTPRLPLPEGATYVKNPAQAQLRELYAACDVWLCGSREEGFHLPPLEAMACRTPVVSTRVGGAFDVVTEGVNGHLVDIGDVGALADRLARVAALPSAEWKRMSDAAHARARSYTWDDATDRLEALLREMAGH